MLLMIDNYDSFTYNIVQYFGELGEDVRVYRNDEITIEEIEALNPTTSASPARKIRRRRASRSQCSSTSPARSRYWASALATRPSAKPSAANHPRQAGHAWQTSLIAHTGVGVFKTLPSPFTVIRYHSLAIERSSLPACLEVTAWTDDGEIMGVRHKEYDIEGVQFHPESILSEHGTHAELPVRRTRALAALTLTCQRSHAYHPSRSTAALHRTPRDFPRRDAAPVPPDHVRRNVADHDRGPDHGPAREKGNHRRNRRRRAGHARVLHQGADGRHTGLLDIVGTGGDGAHTFNISTASMFVAALPVRAWPSMAAAACRPRPAAPT
jgi:anthranilate synthase component 2